MVDESAPFPPSHMLANAWLQDSLCVVQARFGTLGELLKANAGFRRLLDIRAPQLPGDRLSVHTLLQSPTLDQLRDMPPDGQGQVYVGRLQLGWPGISIHSLIGKIHRDGDILTLLAEHDVEDWERLQSKVLALNEDLIASQRDLARANRNLAWRVAELDAALALSRTQAQELRIAAIAFETQESMFIADEHLRLLRVNPAFTRHTGIEADQATNLAWTDILSSRHRPGIDSEVQQALALRGLWEGELWCKRSSGSDGPSWLTLTAVKDEQGRCSHYVGCFLDISARKAAEEEIFQLAFYDPLTQLPNRRLLLDRLQHALAAQQRSGTTCALIFLDLDNFKSLNDTLGHDFGDALLQAVARQLGECLREGDTVARLGGDEFIVLLEGLDRDQALNQAHHVAHKLMDVVTQHHTLSLERDGSPQQAVHFCSASIGIAVGSQTDEQAEDLMRHADLAMYQAKALGRHQICCYESNMHASLLARTAMESDLREALRTGQLQLHYQVQIDAQGRPIGAEALVRWQHPNRGWIPPVDFIPLAEESGLIVPLGDWVLRAACEQLARWSLRPDRQFLSLAVNVSARQFRQPDFVDTVQRIVQDMQISPQRLELELTESTLLNDADAVMAKMLALRQGGMGLALDDFGTGYSSLSYLKRLPLNRLKIDRSFVAGLPSDAQDASICRSIIGLAGNLGIAVIAEGVESTAQHRFLIEQGCSHFQGYLFGKPVPIADLERQIDHLLVGGVQQTRSTNSVG